MTLSIFYVLKLIKLTQDAFLQYYIFLIESVCWIYNDEKGIAIEQHLKITDYKVNSQMSSNSTVKRESSSIGHFCGDFLHSRQESLLLGTDISDWWSPVMRQQAAEMSVFLWHQKHI